MALALDRTLFHFATDVRVRWADTDAVGIAYNGAFLTYFEVARVEFQRALMAWKTGVHIDHESVQDRLFTTRGTVFTLVSSTIDWRAPAKVDNRLRVETRVSQIGRTSYSHEYVMTRVEGGLLIAVGTTAQVRVDPVTMRPLALDDATKADLVAFEEALRTGAARFPPRLS